MPTLSLPNALLLASPGILITVINWMIFFRNRSGKKWVSGIVLFGGVWTAVALLLSPYRWLALLGFTDPGVWQLIAALLEELITDKHNTRQQ